MNIGIDIDGVLQNIYKFMIEEGSKYCKENNKGKLINPNAYNISEMFGWDDATYTDFWIKNIFLYAENEETIPKASENLKKLKNDGHNLCIITARWLGNEETNEYFHFNTGEKMRNTVKEWLTKNDIIYDNIIFSGGDKSKHIIQNNIDVMIEDSPNNLNSLSKITKMICVDWPYNRDVEGDNIYRCYNWDEVYNKISELSIVM